ncbi:retrovirus-related pol polyprotein from transposon TNT 1-94 [Tanacetum coccineum]
MNVSLIPTTRIDKDHPKDQIIGDLNSAIQTKRMTKISDEHAMVEKALYVYIKAPRAGYKTLSTYLNLKMDLEEVHVDDIIFESTKKSLCDEFEGLMHKRFQMSSMGELTLFLGLQQKEDGIFISKDKYVAKILKKFDFATVKIASTPIETNKALVKDEEAEAMRLSIRSGKQNGKGYHYCFYLRCRAGQCSEQQQRSDLDLEDADGTDCLPTATIFEELARMGRKQKKNIEVPHPSDSTVDVPNEEHVPTHSNDPLVSGEDRMKLTKLMDICTKLSERVLDLEHTKTTQAHGKATKWINSITHNFSALRTPQSNSVVKRKNRTLQMSRTTLNDIVDETLEINKIVNIKESRNHPLENVIGNLNQRTLRSQVQNQSNFFCFISTIEPKNVNEALTDDSWIVVMQEELNQFIANNVWELVPQPRNMTIIGTKWVFRNKLDENGIVSRNKARKGRGSFKLIIDQNIVRDDIIFGSTCQDMCDEFAKIMHDEFEMSMMGELNFFLGLQIKQMEDGIFFNQSKYIKEMLKKFGLEESKPMKTPMSSDTKLTKDEECESVDSTKYRGMIGSLLYLTTSRPDIMFSVYLCARFQEAPKTSHLEVVKRIFRYIKGTTHLGLWYPKGTSIETVVYADSDHAGDYVDRKSTSGIYTFVGCCLTSWFSKKQTALAISTTEAEYVSAKKACQQALWMKQALIDYDVRLDDVPIMKSCLLAYGVPTDGPYQTNPPSPNDIISSIQIDREGQVRRIRHEEEIDVLKYQVLTHEIEPTLKPLEEIIQENVFCLGVNLVILRKKVVLGLLHPNGEQKSTTIEDVERLNITISDELIGTPQSPE